MGTSRSNPGSGSPTPLVPPWADHDGEGPGPEPPPHRFRSFRTDLGRFVRDGNIADLRSALGHYARTSTGGADVAVRRLSPVIRVGGALLSLFTGLQRGGTGVAESGINVAALAGSDVGTVIDAIINALSPPGGSSDDELIRQSMDCALAEMLGGQESFDTTAITNEMVVDLCLKYLIETVFNRMLLDAGQAFDKAGSPERAIQAENEMYSIVEALVTETAGPTMNTNLRTFERDQSEELIQDLVRQVWGEMENLYD